MDKSSQLIIKFGQLKLFLDIIWYDTVYVWRLMRYRSFGKIYLIYSETQTINKDVRIYSSSAFYFRLEGSVLRFDFAGDPNHSSGEESRLTNFVEGNKGLIVAWGMRMMALWPDVAERVTAIKRILDDNIPQSSVTQQDRWKTAVANLLLVNMMVCTYAIDCK